MNLIGQSFGRYHILEQLGEGGMATVYRAYDTRLDADVAVKVIRRSAFPPEQLDQMLKRFEREAKSLAKLSHANIVGVIDYGDYEGAPYLVMEYLPGGTLKQKLGKPLSCREAARILLPIARALDFAHRKGMAHRDVKPSNILITADGDPMLTDFGIAKILEAQEGATLTGTGVGIGTPEYMAPEQWTGQAGPSSDIYSLGVVFYEMLTGRKPYEADTPAAVLLKQASDPLPNPRELVPDLPYQAEHVLLRALAKKPEDRFPTMADFAVALDNLAGEPTVASQAPSFAAAAVMAKEPNKPEEAVDLKTMMAGKEISTASETVIATGQAETQNGVRKPIAKEKPVGKGKGRWWLWAVVGVVAIGLIATGVTTLLPGILSSDVNATLLPTKMASNQDTPKPVSATAIPATPRPSYSTQDCDKAEVFCVGLVTVMGAIDDGGFNQSAWEGVLQAKEQGLVQVVQFIETQNANDYDHNIRVFVDNNYDAIVTVGWAMAEATQRAALEYPQTLFIGVDQSWDPSLPWPSNLAGLNFPEDQAGFLVGALAAQMSKTGHIGAVCGTDAVPAVVRFAMGYRLGAEIADQQTGKNTLVDVIYHPNDDRAFVDPEWGAATANELLEKGADVIFGCGGETGNGAIIAAAQAGRFVIGVDSDQFFTLPEAAPRMLSSAMKDITPGVLNLLKAAKEGLFTGGYVTGSANFAPYHDLEMEVPNDVKNRMEELFIGMMNGEILTTLTPVHSCKSDPLSCITINPGEPIHIAYALALEGDNQTLGLDSRNGAEIALEDIKGTILGHEIRFDGLNSGCNTDDGYAALAELSTDPTVVGVIGPSCSSEARAGMSLLSKAGFSAISPSSTAPELTEPGNKNNHAGFLRTAQNDIIQGAVAAEFAYNVLGIRKVAIVNDGSPYSVQLQDIFAENFNRLDGTITSLSIVTPDQLEYGATLGEIVQANPEMIYLPVLQPAGSHIIVQARQTPGLEKVTLMGADGLFSQDFATASDDALDGFLLSGPIIQGHNYEKFVQKYEARFGTAPIAAYHAHAYDAFMLLKAAIERVALVDADGTLHIGRQALRDALYATLNFHGITGILSCTPTGDCANPAIGIYEYHSGEYPPTLIFP